jgi:hypothetical protein
MGLGCTRAPAADTLCSAACLCAEGGPLRAQQRWRHVGGLPPAMWQFAPPLREVRQRLAELLQGRILVGHHLQKDLKALALAHPEEATRDTLSYRCAFCAGWQGWLMDVCLPAGQDCVQAGRQQAAPAAGWGASAAH